LSLNDPPQSELSFARGYWFVEPALVEGALSRGFELLDRLREPLARATGILALITECQPFDDGNGRIARLAANAELSTAGEVRLVIPNVYRNHYLAALTGFSKGAGHGEQLVAVLEFLQRWAAAEDWTSFDGANTMLESCNAYLDAGTGWGVRWTPIEASPVRELRSVTRLRSCQSVPQRSRKGNTRQHRWNWTTPLTWSHSKWCRS
jgi:hypothetical protein